MDWLFVKGARVIRISDEPETVYPVHEPKDEKKRREAREAQRRRDFSLRGDFDDYENFSEPLKPGEGQDAVAPPVETTAPPEPTTSSNPTATSQAEALVTAAATGAPLCEN